MRWTVSRRIAAGFAVVLGLVVVLAAVGALALARAVAAYEGALGHEREIVDPALHAESETREAALEYQRFLLTGDERFVVRHDSALAMSRALLRQVRGAAGSGEERAPWEESLTRLEEWEAAVVESMAARRGGNPDDALRIWESRAFPARSALRQTIDRAVEGAAERSEAAASAAERAASRMKWLLLVVALLALAVGVVSAVLLTRAVAGPLRETTTVLASAAAEILAAATQQASGASETSAAIAQTATTVDEVAQTAEQAADRARTVADSARRAAEIGRTGRQAVDDSAAAMTGVKEQVESIADSILVLAEQAQAIGEIIATVNDLADQTNLLALNAAVEAARAGEHGRGFSVVAAEVRSLADQSKRATVQVRQILGEIQRATSAAVMTTERGSHQAAAGMEQVTAAGETIRTLAEAVTDAAQTAAQIVASAGQQAAGMAQIRQAMESIHEATQQNLASTRQTEGAAQDLNHLGGRLLALVGRNGTGPARA